MESTNRKPGATNTGQTQRTPSTEYNTNPHLNSQDLVNLIDNQLIFKNKLVAFLEKYKHERQRRQLTEQQWDTAITAKNKQISILENTLRWKDKDIISQNRKNEYLRWQLYETHIWTPAQEISWLKDFFNMDIDGCIQQIGKRLSEGSRRSQFNPRKVAHPKLGFVNIYHEYVLQEFHRHLLKYPHYMKQFRKY